MIKDSKGSSYVCWNHFMWVFITAGLFLASAVIANDRIRATEDQRIENSFGTKLDVIQKDIVKIKVVLGVKE